MTLLCCIDNKGRLLVTQDRDATTVHNVTCESLRPCDIKEAHIDSEFELRVAHDVHTCRVVELNGAE